ncbi:MAG: ParB N-terminal domain-containing protein [Streptosporangiaceae bacterium]|nr:ParB N-terminal domain-containing protein [Streptosporangiaceae bacterium]
MSIAAGGGQASAKINPRFPGEEKKIYLVSVDAITLAESPRLSGENKDHTIRLAEIDPDSLPPILIDRRTMRIIDGSHRFRAAILRGDRTVRAEFFDGSEDDAFIRAVRENIAHGLPLTLGERKAAAARIISIQPHLSDRIIASYAGLADKTVAAIRLSTPKSPRLNPRVGADGRVRPLSSRAGRQRAVELIAARPDAPLREIANEAGISIGTAHDVRKRIKRGQDPVDVGHTENTRSRDDEVSAVSAPPTERAIRRESDNDGTDSIAIMGRLVKDPTLRHSESGRELLRWLHAHVSGLEEWRKLIDVVPEYQAENISQLARRCADAWEIFAQELKQRGTPP